LELVQRMETFLNEGITPHVREFGSIGASGDLVPWRPSPGADRSGPFLHRRLPRETLDAPSALARLRLEPLRLGPKEGLAMVNGTSVMTGIAANCLCEARALLALSLGIHSLFLQALRATNQSFHPSFTSSSPTKGRSGPRGR